MQPDDQPVNRWFWITWEGVPEDGRKDGDPLRGHETINQAVSAYMATCPIPEKKGDTLVIEFGRAVSTEKDFEEMDFTPLGFDLIEEFQDRFEEIVSTEGGWHDSLSYRRGEGSCPAWVEFTGSLRDAVRNYLKGTGQYPPPWAVHSEKKATFRVGSFKIEGEIEDGR